MGDPSDAVLVTGDFNAPPDTRDRRLFEAVGLVSTASSRERFARICQPISFMESACAASTTSSSIGSWRVVNRWVIDAKPDNTFPSDHFGVMAES